MTALTRHTLRIPRTAHYALLGNPAEPPVECWYVCHGYGQLAHRFLRRFEALAAPGRWIVAPEGLSRFYVRGSQGPVGASWMTREDRDLEIADYLAWLDALDRHLLAGADVPTVVLGFSQGCATASRWAARGARRPGRLVLWGEVQAHDLTGTDLAQLASAGVRVQFVSGRNDAVVRPAAVEAAASVLRDAGVAVAVEQYDGGHDIDAATLLRIGGPPSGE